MRIDIITLFPEMFEPVLNESIIGRAQKSGAIEIVCHQLRDYAFDKHRRVDDTPYGGGMGMLMQVQPIDDCYKAICEKSGNKSRLIYMSPCGEVLTQEKVKKLASLDEITLLCGHYEGVDRRVIDSLVDEEISVGDYVLTGGELPALILADAVSRMLPGVLPNDEAKELESHYNGLLEYPQYTRPYEWNGMKVPDVLISGHHGNIEKWRREQSLLMTAKYRPDMLGKADLSESDKKFLEGIITKL